MSIMLTGSVKERRHASTMNIDRLFTADMLKSHSPDDALISAAITPLPIIARVVDNAAATPEPRGVWSWLRGRPAVAKTGGGWYALVKPGDCHHGGRCDKLRARRCRPAGD